MSEKHSAVEHEPPPSQRGEPIIRLQNIVKRFGKQTVLEDINLDVYPGETMVVMGGSGSGKSTTLRVMIGSIKPNGGSVEMFDKNISELGEDDLNEVRKKFGILFQSGALFNSMTTRRERGAAADPGSTRTLDERDHRSFRSRSSSSSSGSAEHAADKYPSEISGGMKKRAGLARALALDPQILFYDEPSARDSTR